MEKNKLLKKMAKKIIANIKNLESTTVIMLSMIIMVSAMHRIKLKNEDNLNSDAIAIEELSQPNTSNLELTTFLNKTKDPIYNSKRKKVEIQDYEEKELNKWVNVEIKNGDTLYNILKKLNICNDSMHKILALNRQTKNLSHLVPGKMLKILLEDSKNDKQSLKELIYEHQSQQSIVIKKVNNKFKTKTINKPTTVKLIYKEGKISQSLFKTAQEIGLNDRVTMELTRIFGWNIDFALDIRKDDEIKILFEEIYVHDKKIKTGNIIAAEFINKGKSHKAIRYTIPGKSSHYYSPDGTNLESAFVRTPVKFTRISSKFYLKRKHPVLHKIRAHKGVDYAAPKGTPVTATGNGYVQFIGNKGGYGKVIILKHGSKYTTLYAHLSKFANNLKKGNRVQQGQVIGYVGMTGLATGNHLHYEFRINGIHRNPLTVKLPKAPSISKEHKTYFLAHAEKTLGQMQVYAQNEKERLIMVSNLANSQ